MTNATPLHDGAEQLRIVGAATAPDIVPVAVTVLLVLTTIGLGVGALVSFLKLLASPAQ